MQASTKRTTRTAEIYDLIPPERGTRREPVRHPRALVVEDAVFEVVVPLHPRREHNDNPARSAPSRRSDVTRLAAVAGVFLVNRLERLLSTLSPQAFMTLIASLFFLVFWLCGGFAALATQPVAKPAAPFIDRTDLHRGDRRERHAPACRRRHAAQQCGDGCCHASALGCRRRWSAHRHDRTAGRRPGHWRIGPLLRPVPAARWKIRPGHDFSCRPLMRPTNGCGNDRL